MILRIDNYDITEDDSDYFYKRKYLLNSTIFFNTNIVNTRFFPYICAILKCGIKEKDSCMLYETKDITTLV